MPSLNRSLNVIGRCGALFRAKRLSETRVDPCNYFYLFYLCHHPGISQEELGQALYVNKSSVTRHISALEREGLLTRTPSPTDKRVMLVYPTQQAIDALPFLRTVGKQWQDALTVGFTPEETAQFSSLLLRAMENAERAIREDTV